ncbi:hypothetical protein N9C08_03760, partial [Rubripirellula sp.]|nr:hypothetical protein [Rubripirellula sp.]
MKHQRQRIVLVVLASLWLGMQWQTGAMQKSDTALTGTTPTESPQRPLATKTGGPQTVSSDSTDHLDRPKETLSPAERQSLAEAKLGDGDFDAVTLLYESESLNRLSPRDAYLLGTAQYRRQEFEMAIASFLRAATSLDNRLATDARYNLGNAKYSEALRIIAQATDASAAAETANKAQQRLSSAIDDFRSALKVRP